MPALRRLSLAAAVLVGAGLVAACTPTVSMTPAPLANDPLCAEVSVRLPDAIGDQKRIWTDAQATGAWGAPSIALTCGFEAPAPTAELPCVTLGGVDWLVDESDFPRMRMTSYGRQPAVQVYVDTEQVSSNQALTALGPLVTNIPATGACTETATLDD